MSAGNSNKIDLQKSDSIRGVVYDQVFSSKIERTGKSPSSSSGDLHQFTTRSLDESSKQLVVKLIALLFGAVLLFYFFPVLSFTIVLLGGAFFILQKKSIHTAQSYEPPPSPDE
jgi:hypothetical protein